MLQWYVHCSQYTLVLVHLFLQTVSVSYFVNDWTDFDHMTTPAPPQGLEKYNIGLVDIPLFNTQQTECFDFLLTILTAFPK